MELPASKKVTALFFFTLFLLIHFNALGQGSVLKRKISINVENKTVGEVLDIISKKGKFYFSYNSDIVDKNKRIPFLKEKNITVKSLLTKVIGDNIEPVETGKYVILRAKVAKKEEKSPDTVVPDPPEQKKRYVITGYITNSRTGERLSNATIYEIGKTNSVLTNINGYYTLTVSSKSDNLGLVYSRQDFKDTVIVIQPANHSINMRLKPKDPPPEPIKNKTVELETPEDSARELKELPLVKFAVKQRQFSLSENLKFIEKQHFQVSLIPQLGTNKLMSGNVENNVSFNILGGYSSAVKGIELGGFLNIVRNDVTGLQIGGFGNIVGGNTKGVQLSGFFNNNRKSVNGVQAAGFANVVLDTITGVQVSGFTNILKGKMNGLQLAGFSNITTENVDGVQVSGFNNYARKDVKFAQITGFANYGRNIGGVQIAGFANAGNDVGGAQVAGFVNYSSGEVGGVQVAGYVNIAQKVNSSQVAGFLNVSTKEITGVQVATFNFAKKVKGVQVGLINYADSVSGMSIGLLSFVRKGIHKPELAINANRYATISFKTGTHRFYNIFTAGRDIYNSNHKLYGYGVGTEFFERKKYYWGFNFMANYVDENFEGFYPINVHLKIDSHFGWRFFRTSAIAVAPSMNFMITDWRNAAGSHLSSFAPYEMFETFEEGFKFTGWVGLSMVLRI